MKRVVVLLASFLFAGSALTAGFHFSKQSLLQEVTAEGRVATGLRVAGEPVPADGELLAFVEARAAQTLDLPVELVLDEQSLGVMTLRELGGSADVQAVVAEAERYGHEGSTLEKVNAARRAAAGEVDLPLHFDLPVELLSEKLSALKEETDRKPRAARRLLDGASDRVAPHENGALVDVYAVAEALLVAAQAGEAQAKVGRRPWAPVATEAAVAAADISTTLGSFETKFGGAPGRNKNIERATAQLDGTVLMPGEQISFNEIVGPRTTDNGFFPAPEIYKGEMREGIGGGACQAASTVYAAAFYAGLLVEQRRNHSRPSAYIRSGLDATVSYPVLDLKVRNPFDYPIVLSASAKGGVMAVKLLGKKREVNVSLATQTKAILKYSRKLERSGFLPAGEFKVKQRGKRGLSILRLKTVEDLASGEVKVEESVDIYPPTQEIVIVAPDVKEADLPPIEPPT
jgi:vancomycin resistance protein YoaR